MNTEYMSTLNSFKAFMVSDAVPNYVLRYCSGLNKGEWSWFYKQMQIALDLTDEPEYLFYVLKWMLKDGFVDIGYEMYWRDIMDPEGRDENLIKHSKREECTKKYHKKFVEDFGIIA